MTPDRGMPEKTSELSPRPEEVIHYSDITSKQSASSTTCPPTPNPRCLEILLLRICSRSTIRSQVFSTNSCLQISQCDIKLFFFLYYKLLLMHFFGLIHRQADSNTGMPINSSLCSGAFRKKSSLCA